MNDSRLSTTPTGSKTISWVLCIPIAYVFLFMLFSGCTSAPQGKLLTHFETDLNALEVIHKTFPKGDTGRIPLLMAIVLEKESHDSPIPLTEGNWLQFASKVKGRLQEHVPVALNSALRFEGIPNRDAIFLGQEGSDRLRTAGVLMVLPSTVEVQGPAHFDVLPEVGSLNGSLIENYALVEIALINPNMDKRVITGRGSSFATLEKLDVPLVSNRYPRVRGSAMTSPVYPEEEMALETLRQVALDEALEKAILDFANNWPARNSTNPVNHWGQPPTES